MSSNRTVRGDSPLPAQRARLVPFILAILLVPLLAIATRGASPVAAATAAPTGLHVVGNRLLDGAGHPLLLHGVNRAGSEYACIQGWGFFDGDNSLSDDSQIPLMQAWGVKAVNLPLNEDCWLGINGVPAAYAGANYQQAIRHEVQALEAAGITPILALFWSAPGNQQALDHAAMPDTDHTPAFWQSVATAFKGDSAVILRLDEEPHPAGNSDTAAAWRCWRDGGGACSEGYAVAGMQTLIDTIRATGAANVIQVPGIQYANSLSQFLTYKPADPLGNLMAVVDVYPVGNICGSVSCYDTNYAPVAAVMPLVAGELGESADGGTCTTTRATALMDWLDAHNAGYLAWAWDTWGGCLQLIKDYTTGAPQGAWGQAVKARLLALAASPAPSPSPSPSSSPKPTPSPSPSARPSPSPSPSVKPSPSPSPSPKPSPSPSPQPSPSSSPSPSPAPAGTLVLYDNAVRNGFQDGPFAYQARKPCDTATYTSATCSYAITLQAWGALAFNTARFDPTPYSRLEWNVNTHGQAITAFSVLLTDATTAEEVIVEVTLKSAYVTPLANGWVHIAVPLADIDPRGVAISSVQLKNATGGTLAAINVDDVRFAR
jgi:hypothetical protein